MSRPLQSRCFVTSAAAHVALLVLLVVGAGFQKNRQEELDLGPALELIPGDVIDQLTADGRPAAAPVEAAPPDKEPVVRATEPAPVIPQARVTPPPAEPVRPEPREQVEDAPEPTPTLPKKLPDEREVPKPQVREKPKFDFTQTRPVRTPAKKVPATPAPSERPRTPSPSPFRALDRQLAAAAGSLADSVSRSTVAIRIAGGSSGRGGGGGGSVNAASIRNTYDAAWITPQNVSDDQATTEVEVTIAGDGTVVRARTVRSSGIAALDRSVEDALRVVKRITPFELFEKDQNVTFTIGFNLQGRR